MISRTMSHKYEGAGGRFHRRNSLFRSDGREVCLCSVSSSLTSSVPIRAVHNMIYLRAVERWEALPVLLHDVSSVDVLDPVVTELRCNLEALVVSIASCRRLSMSEVVKRPLSCKVPIHSLTRGRIRRSVSTVIRPAAVNDPSRDNGRCHVSSTDFVFTRRYRRPGADNVTSPTADVQTISQHGSALTDWSS